MKHLFFLAIFTSFMYLGTIAQNSPGNSAYGHSHKKAKHNKHHGNNAVFHREDTDRRPINVKHRTAIKTIKTNDDLTKMQTKEMVKDANVTHKNEMKNETHDKKGKK